MAIKIIPEAKGIMGMKITSHAFYLYVNTHIDTFKALENKHRLIPY